MLREVCAEGVHAWWRGGRARNGDGSRGARLEPASQLRGPACDGAAPLVAERLEEVERPVGGDADNQVVEGEASARDGTRDQLLKQERSERVVVVWTVGSIQQDQVERTFVRRTHRGV